MTLGAVGMHGARRAIGTPAWGPGGSNGHGGGGGRAGKNSANRDCAAAPLSVLSIRCPRRWLEAGRRVDTATWFMDAMRPNVRGLLTPDPDPDPDPGGGNGMGDRVADEAHAACGEEAKNIEQDAIRLCV